MELYIPPPTHYLPRLAPPRPMVPTVPVVPPPDLPDTLAAPEGTYHLAPKTFFPEVEVPGPLPSEVSRPGTMPMGPGSAFMGAAGFGMTGPSFTPMPTLTSPNIFAVSAGSSLVNGQWQPGHSPKMTFADVWYPARVPGKESSFGTLVRLGLGKKAETPAPQAPNAAPKDLHEEEYSDTESETSSTDVPAPAAKHNPISPHGECGPSAAKGKGKKQDKSLSSSRGGIITRVSPNLNLGSIMDEKGKNGGERVRWAFWNMGRLFCWAEEGGSSENLATVVFQSPPTAHAISQLTVGPERQDIVVGLETGDLIYLDFINDRMERFNAGGKVIKSAVTGVYFDPRGGDRFVVSFADNTIVQAHLYGEDPSDAAMAIIAPLPRPWTSHFDAEMARLAEEDKERAAVEEAKQAESGPPSPTKNERNRNLDRLIEWVNDEWAVPASERDKKGEKYPWAGRNPLAVARLGCDTVITAMAYSPDGRWLAITTKDGLLRLVDTEVNRVTDVFESYFGSLKCVAWSQDSRFVAVGGEDDLVTIYSARESRLVARCQGHTGFVTGIAFDPTMRSEGRGYRFGSVGEDGKLLLWDFSVAALRKPRHHHLSNASHYRIASNASLPLAVSDGATFHPAPPKSEVAMLQPVLARVVEGNLMSALYMGPKTIATVSRAGSIKFWTRPPRQPRKKRSKKVPSE